MNARTVRNTVFHLHRILGLAVELVLIIVGLTGSLLVFQHEINHWQVERQFGHVIPQAQQVSVPTLLETVQTTFANQPDLKLLGINTLPDDHTPYRALLKSANDKLTEVFVNPYT